ncbi:HMG box domain-containing protein [Mycena indigotica]|uniref:HMG box domain-containing protein n=1 Tax=Mycena indigotica TaxID=2126181 RepID=A0A8H6SPH0_9AGAR|nr:HMG box domain-containing protein [Mycena indigotica]KAF7303605.1 HMG box domain-containing protein [Mycena indigotica]
MTTLHTYHTNSPSDGDDDYPPKVEGEDDADAALTSQTLNADGTPKRPMNAFMIFARRRRPQVSAENQSMRTGDISKILSQEWKSMAASEKQFYQNQAKLLKENFNSKYPDYVYKRRPNNSRKKRKPENAAIGGAPRDRDTDEAESSPDAEDAVPLPDHGRGSYYGSGGSSSYGGSGSSYGHHPYNGYSGSAHTHHHRSTSYPYPPHDTYRTSSSYNEPSNLPRLLSSPYYPPPSSSHSHSSSSYDPSTSPHLGLRKAQSNPAIPPGGPASSGWPTTTSNTSTSGSSYPATSYNPPNYSPAPRYSSVPDSPGTRYSPFAGASSNSASSGSPAPTPSYNTSTTSNPTNGGSPGHSYASLNGHNHSNTPRSLVSGLGTNSSGLGGLGMGGAGDSYFWRPTTGASVDKLL